MPEQFYHHSGDDELVRETLVEGEVTIQMMKFDATEDSIIPENELWFMDNGKIVAKITGIVSAQPGPVSVETHYSLGACEVCDYQFTSKWHAIARLKRWLHYNTFIHFGVYKQ